MASLIQLEKLTSCSLVDSNILTQVFSETETASCRVKSFFLIEVLLSKIGIGLILFLVIICSGMEVELEEGLWEEGVGGGGLRNWRESPNLAGNLGHKIAFQEV